MILEPDYPNVVFAFPYRGVRIEITQSEDEGISLYSAWVEYAQGSAVAVPKAYSRNDAIRRARHWVDQSFSMDRQ